jgi:hypothetical protein
MSIRVVIKKALPAMATVNTGNSRPTERISWVFVWGGGREVREKLYIR